MAEPTSSQPNTRPPPVTMPQQHHPSHSHTPVSLPHPAVSPLTSTNIAKEVEEREKNTRFINKFSLPATETLVNGNF